MEYSTFNNDLHSKKSTNIKENIIELRKNKKWLWFSGYQDNNEKEAKQHKNILMMKEGSWNVLSLSEI